LSNPSFGSLPRRKFLPSPDLFGLARLARSQWAQGVAREAGGSQSAAAVLQDVTVSVSASLVMFTDSHLLISVPAPQC
jgi:hypothetical protein